MIVGGGFVGTNLALQLAHAGHRVVVFSRSFAAPLMASASDLEINLVQGTVPPGDGLTTLIDEADVVFYLAGGSTPAAANSDPGGSMMAHVVPAAALLDLMSGTSTRRVVIASSGGTVYGRAGTYPTPEDHPLRPANLHGQHCVTVERYA